MDTDRQHRSPASLMRTWLALCALTLLSLGLGRWFHASAWLPLLVAAIVWIKGILVANEFLECRQSHPFIAWVLRVFIALAPLALVATAFFGTQLARWTTL
jgi:hypothetical protein